MSFLVLSGVDDSVPDVSCLAPTIAPAFDLRRRSEGAILPADAVGGYPCCRFLACVLWSRRGASAATLFMYDVHSHILPGLDDGAKTVDEFVAMARAAVSGGTTVMLATPHRRDVTENFSIPYLRELAAKMVDTLAARGVGLTLVQGMENHLDADLPEALARGAALPMNGTRYALVELPFFGHPDFVEPVLADIPGARIHAGTGASGADRDAPTGPGPAAGVRRTGDAHAGDRRQRDRAVRWRGEADHPRSAQGGGWCTCWRRTPTRPQAHGRPRCCRG